MAQQNQQQETAEKETEKREEEKRKLNSEVEGKDERERMPQKWPPGTDCRITAWVRAGYWDAI